MGCSSVPTSIVSVIQVPWLAGKDQPPATHASLPAGRDERRQPPPKHLMRGAVAPPLRTPFPAHHPLAVAVGERAPILHALTSFGEITSEREMTVMGLDWLAHERNLVAQEYSEAMGTQVVNEQRRCPMCGSESWILLDGRSVLQALEGGLEALAYSCKECGFIRWHRSDKAEQS